MSTEVGLLPTLIAAALLLLLPTDTNSDVQLQVKQDPVHVFVHEDVALQCLLLGYDKDLPSEKLGVLWKFGNIKIFSYTTGTIYKMWNNTEIYEEDILHKNMTLVVRNATIHHEGRYRCEVLIAPDHMAFGTTTLLVSARPSVTVTSPENVQVGREASLICDVNGYYDSSILIEWIQIRKESSKAITSNVCREPPKVNSNGTFSASVQISVEPAVEDIGNWFSCRVRHRSFAQDHIVNGSIIVEGQAYYISTEIAWGTFAGFLLSLLMALLIYWIFVKFSHTVPPKVSEIKAVTRIIHKEMAQLKVDVSGFHPHYIQITWKVKHGTGAPRTITCTLNRKSMYACCMYKPRRRQSNDQGIEDWIATLSEVTKNSDGTYNVSSELSFEPNIRCDDDAKITCDVIQKDTIKHISKQMILNVEGVPPKVAGIIRPPFVLHELPVGLTCPINDFKPRDITITWHKKRGDDMEEEDLDMELSSNVGPNSCQKGKYTHAISHIDFGDHTHSVNSVLLFKPTIVHDNGAKYICRITHLVLKKLLDVFVQLDIKACPVMEAISCDPPNPEAGKSLMLKSMIHSFYPGCINITWWKNNRRLPDDSIHTYAATDKTANSLYACWSECTVHLTLEDSGKIFKCSVEHESLAQPLELEYICREIAMAPKVGVIQCYPAVPEPRKQLTLSCEINQYFPSDIQVEWYKGTTRIDKKHVKNEERWSKEVFSMTSRFTFKPTIEDHQLEFRLEVCHSTISKQPVAQSFILQFPGLPLFSDFSLDPQVPQYGKQLALKCSVNGLNSKDFRVGWFQNGKQYTDGISNDGPLSTSGGYRLQSVLHFTVTAEDFEKEIVFQLWNSSTKETYKNRICLPLQAVSPRVSEISCSSDSPRRSERVTLVCSARGFSPKDIHILWSRGWSGISPSDSMEKLTLEENGLYCLNAELVVAAPGSDEPEYLFEVYHPQTSTTQERKYVIKYRKET